jgi:hypothetical protein
MLASWQANCTNSGMNKKPAQKSQDGFLDATALAIGALAGSVTVMAASALPYEAALPSAMSVPSKRRYGLPRRKKMATRPGLTFATI